MKKLLMSIMTIALFLTLSFGVGTVVVSATEYSSGKIYVGHLKEGDVLKSGVTLYVMSGRAGVSVADITIDGVEVVLQGKNSQYTTTKMLKVYSIRPSVYSKNMYSYVLRSYDEEEYDAQKKYSTLSHLYVGDLKVGDIVGTNSVLHSGSSADSGYSSFEVYLDGSKSRANDNYYEWSVPALERVVAVEPDPINSQRLILTFETFKKDGEVASEGALKAALLRDETIVLTADIELKSRLEISSGEHVINLNDHTLSRNLDSEEDDGQVVFIEKGAKLTVKDAGEAGIGAIAHGNAMNGGGVYVKGELVFEGGNITECEAKRGGGIYVEGKLTMKNKAVTEFCDATDGGAIYVAEKAEANLEDCTIEQNDAMAGGGIFNYGTINLTGVTITTNTAKNGAGIFNGYSGRAELDTVGINLNNNAEHGGGIYTDGVITIKNSNISGNSATYGGGAYFSWQSAVGFEGENAFGSNSAMTGGGIYNNINWLSLEGVTIGGNFASGLGGGLYQNGQTLILKDTVVTENSGGIYVNSGKVELGGGKILVKSNRENSYDSNLSFKDFQTIKVTGTLATGSRIGLTPPSSTGTAGSFAITEDYGKYNEGNQSEFFSCDTVVFRLMSDANESEVKFFRRLLGSYSGYTIKVSITVTDDGDHWDDAYLYFYVRDDRGNQTERYFTETPNFCDSIDDEGDSYEYSVDCGTSFPSAVKFRTQFGSPLTWRTFEAEVKVYINGVNCGSQYVVHEHWGTEVDETKITLAGDKYPYPYIDLDQKSEIDVQDEDSKLITISAVDQYGVTWTPSGNDSYKMVNQTYPGKDIFTAADDLGLKWKLDTLLDHDHYSDYELTFNTGSNVYPTITKTISVHFSFPLKLTVIVDKEVLFTATGKANDIVTIPDLPSPVGRYIYSYKINGACYLTQNEDKKTYTFGFTGGNVVLEANLKGIKYTVTYEKNGDPLLNDKDVLNTMNKKTAQYGKSFVLPINLYERKGYTFTGWNTKADGSGTAFADGETVSNLTTESGATVHLYAQWSKDPSTTTASIFSLGRYALFIGAPVIAIAIIGFTVYGFKKRKTA